MSNSDSHALTICARCNGNSVVDYVVGRMNGVECRFPTTRDYPCPDCTNAFADGRVGGGLGARKEFCLDCDGEGSVYVQSTVAEEPWEICDTCDGTGLCVVALHPTEDQIRTQERERCAKVADRHAEMHRGDSRKAGPKQGDREHDLRAKVAEQIADDIRGTGA